MRERKLALLNSILANVVNDGKPCAEIILFIFNRVGMIWEILGSRAKVYCMHALYTLYVAHVKVRE